MSNGRRTSLRSLDSSTGSKDTQPPKPNLSSIRKVRFQVCKYYYFEPGLEQEIALEDVRKRQLYYTEDDYDRMEIDAEQTLVRMMKSKSSPAKLEKNLVCRRNLSSRGLEARTPKGARDQVRIQTKVVRLVLALQRMQKEGNDLIDSEMIARNYKKAAEPTLKVAHLRGIQDAVFAQWISDGCPEEKEKERENAASRTTDARHIGKSKQKLHVVLHHHHQLPQFNLFCSHSLGFGKLFQHKPMFEAVNAA